MLTSVVHFSYFNKTTIKRDQRKFWECCALSKHHVNLLWSSNCSKLRFLLSCTCISCTIYTCINNYSENLYEFCPYVLIIIQSFSKESGLITMGSNVWGWAIFGLTCIDIIQFCTLERTNEKRWFKLLQFDHNNSLSY